MVLQRDKRLPIWGYANELEKVTVTFNGQKVTSVAKNGKWMVFLKPMPANSTPGTMTFTGENTIQFRNVLVGEVWLCSGQSNMEMPVGSFGIYRGAEDYQNELKDANYPNIRLLQVPHMSSGLPIPELNLTWLTCTPETIYWSSAVSYYFAKKLHRSLNVPIGIINDAWGGSAIQPWTPANGFKLINDFSNETRKIDSLNNIYQNSNPISEFNWQKMMVGIMNTLAYVKPSEAWLSKLKPPSSGHPLTYPAPSSIYNAMIYPLIPYAIRGVIWYQGEANLGDGELYTKRMEALIKGWRNAWGQGDFPFYFVQIAPYTYKDWPVKNATPDLLTKLWEAQKKALSINNTGIANTEDLGELDNIHPRRKKEVGERLADLAILKICANGNP
jgi:sialate O-acetylesterase